MLKASCTSWFVTRTSRNCKNEISYLGAPVEGGWPAQACVLVLLGRRGGAAPTNALYWAVAAAGIVVGRRGEGSEVPVVGGKLGGPDAVGGGCAAERPVEAGDEAYLRRVEVEQHRRHAALRHVAQRRLAPPLRPHHARSPRPHLRSKLQSIAKRFNDRLLLGTGKVSELVRLQPSMPSRWVLIWRRRLEDRQFRFGSADPRRRSLHPEPEQSAPVSRNASPTGSSELGDQICRRPQILGQTRHRIELTNQYASDGQRGGTAHEGFRHCFSDWKGGERISGWGDLTEAAGRWQCGMGL